MHKVFVYGTLRKSKGNHRLLTQINAAFIGNAVTVNKYHLTTSGLPFVNKNIETSQIVGEVYQVDDSGLSSLDGLEGYNPNNHEGSWYKREVIPVLLENGNTDEAALYFNEDQGNTVVYNGDFVNPITEKK
jgi:gamma-glutamylcyclotransferase (GGCT)/AIG2-like uncharacterized protein YtfP